MIYCIILLCAHIFVLIFFFLLLLKASKTEVIDLKVIFSRLSVWWERMV